MIMRKFLLVFTLIVFGLTVKSQTLELYTQTDVLIPYGDTISVDSLPSVNEMVAYVKVKNDTSFTVSVTCEKIYLYIVPGTDNEFCWASTCYPSGTFLSGSEIIEAGVVSNSFLAHYKPLGNEGASYIKYKFKINHGDSAWVVVKFNATTYSGIADNCFTNSISAPYPNPAKSMVYINYNVSYNSKATLQIYNICGKIEKQIDLNNNNGIVTFNVADLPSGIYFCSLNLNGKTVKTNKLIIAH